MTDERRTTSLQDALYGIEAIDEAGPIAPIDIKTRKPKPAPENPLRSILLKPAQWEGVPVPPRRWLAHNRIPMGEVTGLGGDGGMGKTNLALQAVICCGTKGTDWLGSALDEVGPAIFFTAEEPENEIHFRLDQMRQHYRLSWADMANVHPFCPVNHPDIDPVLAGFVKRTGRVEPTRTFGWLREMVLDLKARLVCVEAAADVFDVEEISRGHAKACIRLVQRLMMEADAAGMLLYHPSLSGMASGRGTSGSTQWNNTMRSRLYFQTLPGSNEDEASSRPKVLEVMKANRGPTGEKVILEWRNGLYVPIGGTATVERAAREQYVDDAFLSALKRLVAQGYDVAPGHTSTNSAPKLMKGRDETKGIRQEEIKSAQARLIDKGCLRIEPYGPASKGKKRVVPSY
jgi:RecA-family ATPase